MARKHTANEVQERRQKIWELYIAAGSIRRLDKEEVCKRFDISKRQLYADINKIAEEVQKTPANKVALNVHLTLENSRARYLQLYDEADNIEIKRRILNDLNTLMMSELKAAEMLGLIEKTPERIEVTHEDLRERLKEAAKTIEWKDAEPIKKAKKRLR